MGSYSAVPITVQTWPGPRKACTRLPGDCKIAVMAGGVSTCETSTEKLVSPRLCAAATAMALAGAVVSNPIAKNTTARSGLAAASFTASRGE